jgi:bifunctional non-homologous end joining protein LigD
MAKAKTAEARNVRIPSRASISHPDKMLWPKDRVTKADLAAYYARMAEPLLRFAGGRPLSIIRAPDGIAGKIFFQRHHNRGTSALIGKVRVKGFAKPYLSVDSAAALQAMAQWGVIELHPWGATVRDIERPDQIVFDFDPDAAVPFDVLKRAAFVMRNRLDDLGLVSFPKLTGGKGIHVVVPLKPRADWKEVNAFAHALALAFEQADPAHFTAMARKTGRKGKIFVDYLRNNRSATAIACWSPRARPGAPIAVPVSWAFLKKQRRLPLFTMRRLKAALRHMDDWQDFEASRRVLSRAILRRAGAAAIR